MKQNKNMYDKKIQRKRKKEGIKTEVVRKKTDIS